MNRDQIKGKARNIKGRVKEAAGSLTGDKSTQVEGTFDRASGAVQEKVGDWKKDLDKDR